LEFLRSYWLPNAKRIELMLYSYAFMVSGLFIPVLGALFWKKSHPIAAFEYF
jgi:hypothetical protein